MWMKWRNGCADSVRVFAFDFSKAFGSVNHYILLSKLKQLLINPYIYNWVRDFLSDRQQRVLCDRVSTSFLHINKGSQREPFWGQFHFQPWLTI